MYLSAPDDVSLLFSPGRFFAALEMKLLMAHILLNYDIKLAPSSRPLILHYQISTFPDSKAEVLFKKRS